MTTAEFWYGFMFGLGVTLFVAGIVIVIAAWIVRRRVP